MDLWLLQIHKIVDLSSQLDREALWYMEVAETYNLFYLPSLLAASSSSWTVALDLL
jgi:RecQ-mediated genome instability protein 2